MSLHIYYILSKSFIDFALNLFFNTVYKLGGGGYPSPVRHSETLTHLARSVRVLVPSQECVSTGKSVALCTSLLGCVSSEVDTQVEKETDGKERG